MFYKPSPVLVFRLHTACVELTWTVWSLARWRLSRTQRNSVHNCLNLFSAERNSILIWSHVVFHKWYQQSTQDRTTSCQLPSGNHVGRNQLSFTFYLRILVNLNSWEGVRKINKHSINILTLSISNGIDSELGCSSTSAFTKKKISPLEQTQNLFWLPKRKQSKLVWSHFFALVIGTRQLH